MRPPAHGSRPLFTALLTLFCAGAAQADAPATGRGGPPEAAWQVGAMTLISRSPFAGDGTYARVLPAVSYQSDTLFLQGLQAGYHLQGGPRSGGLGIDLLAALRLQPGAERKKASLDAGLRLSYRFRPASLSLTIRQDVSGVHGGEEVTLAVSRRIALGALSLIPSLEAEWQSRALANHLWGTSAADHRRAVANSTGDALPAYRIDSSVLNYGASVLALYRIDRHWRLTGLAAARYLDSTAAANPGIVHRLDLKAGLGLSYSF